MSENPSFLERLQQRAAKAPKAASDDLWHYREAAAVLASFDYESLHALGDVSPSSTAKAELLADCDVVYSSGGTLNWALRTPIRQAALRRLLADHRIEDALDSNPKRVDSAAQKLLERFLSKRPPSVTALESPEEGRALLEVVDWLSGVSELERQLPNIESVKQRIARELLLQPFRDLVGSNFAGRRNELEQLADYVGIHDAYSVGEAFHRTVERIFSIQDRPPLFINGPGGCGKSTLIAKFILDHAEIEESARFPFAYLDFDRPGLVAEEPITLLADVMRQLAIQFPHTDDLYRGLADEWSSRLSQQSMQSGQNALAPNRQRVLRLEDRESFIAQFANFVNNIKMVDQPLLLVLDTFEEVQFRSTAFADEVLDFLNDLQSRVPKLRTVLSGRAEIHSERYKVRLVAIGNFDKEAAVSYLAGREVPDVQIAERIFEQVGGSPLVLRLAADVAKIETVDATGIDKLQSSWWSIFRKQSIEVVLYKRILSHIYDKRIEQLAYPGLVLRIITPEVLYKVLGPACGIEIASMQDARELVKIMKARLSTILVPGSGDDEVLIHRPDMRSILLNDVNAKALKDDKIAEQLRNIHEKAIQFYGKFNDPAHRAEEIYHRLASGIDREVLASRWQDGLKPFLGSSIRELPSKSQIYLAARLQLELPEELWTEAEDEDWVLYASRLADQKLELQKPFDALEALNERKHLWKTDFLRPVLNRVAHAVFHDYAREYEQLRQTHKPGNQRTRLMNSLVSRATATSRAISPDRAYAGDLFMEEGPGIRIVALAIAEARPYPEHLDVAIATIRKALSPFEQYHALRLARSTFEHSTDIQRRALREALLFPEGTPIHDSDPSRLGIKNDLLSRLAKAEGILRKEPKSAARLSTPIEQLRSHYQIVVIGSGYGGGITASRMARAGQEVCILERGKEFQPGDFDKDHKLIKHGEYPDTEAEALREVQIDLPTLHTGPRTGLYDMRVNDDISVFVGCGLGGTSLLNANVALQADPRVFQLPEWPEEYRNNPNVLSDGYNHAREMLKPTPYPNETRPSEFPPLAKLNALKKSADYMQEPFYRPPINVNFDTLDGNLNHVGVEQHPCVGCGDCMTGCNYRAKNTVIMNYLPDAKNYGAEIFTQVSVRYLSRRDDRWLVHYQLLNTGRDKFDAPTMFVSADIVVLAAGSLGSTEILLRSRNNGLLNLSNQVGDHFTGNGDFLGFAYNCDEEINGIGFGHRPPIDNGKGREKVGPCITGIIDLRNKEPVEDGYVIEEGSIAGAFGGFLPGLLSAAAAFLGKDTDSGVGDKIKERARELESLVRGAYHGAVRNTQIFLTMAHDDNKGQLKLEDDRLRIHWPKVGDQPIFKEVAKKQQEATAALGGTYLKNPVANKITGEDLVTVHPLGGCVMADSADKGVVNHKGQVFSGTQGTAVYDSLYVSDGSVIPRPLGVNPLLTISAVAERACVLMAQDRGWTFDYALPSTPQEPSAPLKLGVRFSESMSGYFSPAVTDEAEDAYQRGMDQGRADGSPFQFIVTIISDDLERTITDVNYVSPMLGTATAPALSMQALTITEGQFNYFLLDRDRVETKRMQYKMKLSSVEGKTYYFYGFKVIHDDPGFDSWSDTTTLYITLYEGENEQGRVLGKGILRIPIASFMRQMTTMQVTNAGSLTERWQAMLKFGRFFGGQLVDTYGVNLV